MVMVVGMKISPKNGSLFHFFPVTVAENSWKNQMSSNFVFSSCRMVVESRQMAAEILFGPRAKPEGRNGSRLPFACLRPPFCNEKRQNYSNLVFFKCFLQRDW